MAIGRLTATLIFVGSHKSGVRRKLPLTRFARLGEGPRVHR